MNYAFFIPFAKSGGWYIGAGGGYLFSEYTFPQAVHTLNLFAANVVTGFNIGNRFDISYALRTNFNAASGKLSVGWTHRFK
jgi:hypothetical protein